MSDSIQAQTHLNNTGLAVNAGWITVYHVDPQTREYRGSSDEYLMQGVGIPANSYADEPTPPEAGQALRQTVVRGNRCPIIAARRYTVPRPARRKPSPTSVIYRRM
ncbi:hypothetical protein [Prodigiosinella confusarubida]|uniref:hypothetical protein n=1 Tax=Serratia sp. (strain ATCC 39006) TaxID=104623 RepID=UPI0003926DA9